MAKIHVDFHIKNEDIVQAFQTQGLLNKNKIAFFDDAKDKHVLTLGKTSVHYHRSGENALDFTFNQTQSTKGTYAVSNQLMEFDIHTDSLLINDNTLYIAYTLKQFGSIVGNSELTLKYEKAQEA